MAGVKYVCACVMTEREEVKNESVTQQLQVLVCINARGVCYRTSENDLCKQVKPVSRTR